MNNENPKPVNRMYKSTLFAMLFGDRENLLELYNAMSGKHYDAPELLEINTLENAIYMSMKNDVSFIIDGRLSLYEHQSTYSPNLPLRFLFYVSSLYSGVTKDENLYGTKPVKIPLPKFVIFYNGEEERPEQEILKLSDLYTAKDNGIDLELKALFLNINGDHNSSLKKACRTLREYAVFTDKMREHIRTENIETAAERTIEDCIRAGILKDFLMKHRSEVKTMSIFEYDQEKHLRMERKEAWEEGKAAGVAEGRDAGLAEGREAGLAEGIEKGWTAGLAKLIQKKLEKGYTLAQIAEMLEEDESFIAGIIEKEKADK